MARHFKLTADGGSRGNPGPAGYGAVVTSMYVLGGIFALLWIAAIIVGRAGEAARARLTPP